MVGKKAARVTPIWALAAAARRSAAATSGRRCSRAEGAVTGIRGGAGPASAAATDARDAGRPIRAAMACSSRARWAFRSGIWARAVCSWVSARSSSRPLAAPPSCRVRVRS